MERDGLENYSKLSNKRLEDIVIMVRGELNKMTRITVEALIVVDVHGTIQYNTIQYII
jgi:dynein heavy chain